MKTLKENTRPIPESLTIGTEISSSPRYEGRPFRRVRQTGTRISQVLMVGISQGTNPDVSNPEVSNPDAPNPDVYNPSASNSDRRPPRRRLPGLRSSSRSRRPFRPVDRQGPNRSSGLPKNSAEIAVNSWRRMEGSWKGATETWEGEISQAEATKSLKNPKDHSANERSDLLCSVGYERSIKKT